MNVAVSCTVAPTLSSTLAGSTTSGSADGTGTAASFFVPSSVAADTSGNLYVADSGNAKIRKITPAGVVTTLAGSGIEGFSNGAATAASFFAPYGVAVDAAGNVYVADMNNHAIRKITPSGTVTTLAGTGSMGSADGTGTAASFFAPRGVAVDGIGNVFVADTSNSKIRKITPAGVVTKLAGSGAWATTIGSAGYRRHLKRWGALVAGARWITRRPPSQSVQGARQAPERSVRAAVCQDASSGAGMP
nr:hypothetical protein [Cupriavidus basilensis]